MNDNQKLKEIIRTIEADYQIKLVRWTGMAKVSWNISFTLLPQTKVK